MTFIGVGHIGSIGAAARRRGGGVSLPQFLLDVKNGIAQRRVMLVGDSLTVGSQGSDTGDSIDAFKNNYPNVLAALATAEGIPTRADSWGNAAYGFTNLATAEAFRPEFDFGGWLLESRFSMSTRSIRNNVDTSTFAVTFTDEYDAVEVWHIVNAVNSAAEFTVTVDSALEATVPVSTSGPAGGSERMDVEVITGLTLDTHLIEFNRVASDVRVTGIIPYRSATPELLLFSIAAGGATAATLNSTAYAYASGYSGVYFPRDFTIIMLGVNEMLSATALATFEANLQSMDDNHSAASEVLYIVPPPISASEVAEATQEDYRDVIRAIAAANDRPLLDLATAWVSYANAQSNGWVDDDGVHLSKAGYADVAARVWAKLKSLP